MGRKASPWLWKFMKDWLLHSNGAQQLQEELLHYHSRPSRSSRREFLHSNRALKLQKTSLPPSMLSGDPSNSSKDREGEISTAAHSLHHRWKSAASCQWCPPIGPAPIRLWLSRAAEALAVLVRAVQSTALAFPATNSSLVTVPEIDKPNDGEPTLLLLCGSGIQRVIGLWNFLRRGSTVTIGETATRLPCSLVTMSCGTGWACTDTLMVFVSEPSGKMACTRGTTDDMITPPSGPTQCTWTADGIHIYIKLE